MAQRIYTKAVQVAMFEAAFQQFGKWTAAGWKAGKPVALTTEQFNEKCELIRVALQKKFSDKAPSTARSIAIAIYWTLDLGGVKPQQPQFRLSAYEGGFMTITDIVSLEQLASTTLSIDETPVEPAN